MILTHFTDKIFIEDFIQYGILDFEKVNFLSIFDYGNSFFYYLLSFLILDISFLTFNFLIFFLSISFFSIFFILCIPRYKIYIIRRVALIFSLILLNLNLLLFTNYDFTKLETQYNLGSKKNIFLYNLNFQLGIDNLSFWFILLTTLLFPFCILIS